MAEPRSSRDEKAAEAKVAARGRRGVFFFRNAGIGAVTTCMTPLMSRLLERIVMLRPIATLALSSLIALLVISHSSTAHADVGPTWCTHEGTQKLVADLNADGRSDLFCYDRNTGAKWVALMVGSAYQEVWWDFDLRWCSHAGASLYLSDVNGDRRADLVCKDSTRVSVDYATSAFYEGTDYYLDTTWCTHLSTSFFVGDQNADGRADLVCRDTTGWTWVDYADSAGRYGGTDAGRSAADLEITNIIQGGTTHQVTVRNNGAAAVVTQVTCTHGSSSAYRSVSISLALGATTNVTLSSLPVFPGTVQCSVTGRGADGQPELFVSNNSAQRTF